MKQVLDNGLTLIQGCGTRLGYIQTEEEGKEPAYFVFVDGGSLVSRYSFQHSTLSVALDQAKDMLREVGIKLDGDKLVPYSEE